MPDGTQGVYTAINDWAKFRPTALSLHMMRQACLWDPANPFARATRNERDLFIKHTGSEAFYEELRLRGAAVDLPRWQAQWNAEAEAFRAQAAPCQEIAHIKQRKTGITNARFITTGKWWLVAFPGLALMSAVLCFNLLGDGLRDILDPRTRT